MDRLKGKVAIVTGSTSGIGVGIAKAFAAEGAKVVICGRREAKGQAVVDSIVAAGGEASYHFMDITKVESIDELLKDTAEKYGKIDILVNCAAYGAGYGKGSQLEYMDDATWQKGIDGALGSVFRGTREVVPYMKEHGGSIVNYCSMYGLVSPDLRIYGDNPQKQPPNYGAAKAGVQQLTRYAAGALAEYGIRVNCVTPGPFPNPANQGDLAFNAKLAAKTMLGRFGKSYEMAGAVLLLASDAGSFMTGTNIVVDGGWTAW